MNSANTPGPRQITWHDERESLVYGERIDGSIAHVSEVSSGLDCNCVCPGCGARLVARKGSKKDHHFGHYRSEDGQPCRTAVETALHKFAKEVLARRRELALPPLEINERHARWVGHPGGVHRFESAVLENRLGQIIPDVIVRKGDRSLLVEFRVTHPCDEAKVAKILAMDLAALEIDLSGLPRDAGRGDLEEAILIRAPRKWLHNPKLRDALLELKRQHQERDQVLGRAAVALRKAYLAACKEVSVMQTCCPAVDRVAHYGLSRAIGVDVPGTGCFTVPPQDWQATILADALDIAASGDKAVITTEGALRKIRHRGWVRRRFGNLTNAEAEAIRADGTIFDLPENAVTAWAMTLSYWGILLPAGGGQRWTLWTKAAPWATRALQ